MAFLSIEIGPDSPANEPEDLVWIDNTHGHYEISPEPSEPDYEDDPEEGFGFRSPR